MVGGGCRVPGDDPNDLLALPRPRLRTAGAPGVTIEEGAQEDPPFRTRRDAVRFSLACFSYLSWKAGVP